MVPCWVDGASVFAVHRFMVGIMLQILMTRGVLDELHRGCWDGTLAEARSLSWPPP